MGTAVGPPQLTDGGEEHLTQDVSPTKQNVTRLDEPEAAFRQFLINNSAEAAEFLLVARTYRHLQSAINSQYD